MSPDSNQRKQELLIRLSESRLNVINEAELLRDSVKKSFSWLSPVTHILKGKSLVVVSLGAALAGLLFTGGIAKFLFPRSSNKIKSGDSSSHVSGFLKNSLLSVLAASVVPALKQALQQAASRKLSAIVAKYFSH